MIRIAPRLCVYAGMKNGELLPLSTCVFYCGHLPWEFGRGYSSSLSHSVGRSPLHTLGNSSCHDMIYGRRTEGRGAEAAAGIEKVWQCLPKRASWARVCEGGRRERGNLYAEWCIEGREGGGEKEREEIKRLIYGLSRRPLRSRQLKPVSRN